MPNPKRIIASRVFFVLGAISATGASIMGLSSLSDNFWIRFIAGFFVFGLIGAGTVEAIRFAGHTEQIAPPTVVPTPTASLPPSPTPAPQAAPTSRPSPTPSRSVRKSGKKRPTAAELEEQQRIDRDLNFKKPE